MKIDLLFFEGCLSLKAALSNLETEALEAEIQLIEVKDNQQAAHLKFLRLPSF